MVKNYVKQMRIKHYIKNLLIYFPLGFAGKIFDIELFVRVTLGFIAFCLVASIIYIINDIKDLDVDRKHPLKKCRPLACGDVSVKGALLLVGILGILTILLVTFSFKNPYAWIFLLLYFLLNISYSFGLKNIPLLDILIIVVGFILRVSFGGMLVDIEVSSWLYLTVMSMSFYLAFGKRKNEILMHGNQSRKVLTYYTEQFLDKMMSVSLGLTIVFYSLWCVTPNNVLNKNEALIWTVPFVFIICMKYTMDTEKRNDGDPAEVLLGDKVLMSLVFLYGITMLFLIYWGN